MRSCRFFSDDAVWVVSQSRKARHMVRCVADRVDDKIKFMDDVLKTGCFLTAGAVLHRDTSLARSGIGVWGNHSFGYSVNLSSSR